MTEALKAVSSGFKLVYVGLLLLVLAVVIAIVGVVAAIAGAVGPGGLQMLFGVAALLLGLSLTSHVITLVGRIKCMAIPASAGPARQQVVISAALEIVTLLLSAISLVNLLAGEFLPAEVAEILEPAASITFMLGTIFFLLFTKSVALFVRRRDLEAAAQSVMMMLILLSILFVVNQVVVRMGAAAGAGNRANAGGAGCVVGIIGLAMLVILIIFVIRYAGLLIAMANACVKYAREGAYGYDDDDYDDDRSRSRRGRGRARDDDEEEEEEEDDRPRRKKRRDDDEWES